MNDATRSAEKAYACPHRQQLGEAGICDVCALPDRLFRITPHDIDLMTVSQ